MKNFAFFFILVSCTTLSFGQFYNKEVKAKILVEENSEFYTFKATAENITPSDYNLRYDFMLFRQDANGNTSKSNQENRFYLQAGEKVILASAVVNYNAEGKIILVLVIYDENQKPIGQDRIELVDGGQTELNIDSKPTDDPSSQDQAKPGDGFVLGGLVVENTITKAGRDFYRYFYADYFNRGMKTAIDIKIDEVPGRARTTLLTVKVGDDIVWQFFTQPRKDYLKKMAAYAMQRTIAHLQRLQQQQQEFVRY